MTKELIDCHCGSRRVYVSPETRLEDTFRGACTDCGIETDMVYKEHNVATVWNRMQNGLEQLV